MKKPVLPASSLALWQMLSGEEIYAHYLYIHIANQLQATGFFGSQKFFESESDSEFGHYKKIRDFVNDMGSVLNSVPSYQITDTVINLEDALNLYYDTELKLLQTYVKAYKEMDTDGSEDCVSEPLLLEFIKIQTSSVGEAGDLLQRYEIAKGTGEILLFDQEMGK
jgi:ferritin